MNWSIHVRLDDTNQMGNIVGHGDRHDDHTPLHDSAGRQRDVTGLKRDEAASGRDEGADDRDLRGGLRDHEGDQRDSEADARDRAADRRDRQARTRDLHDSRSDEADARKNVGIAEVHRVSAASRELASGDRRRAFLDRQDAAAERTRASRDRHLALADRIAGGTERRTSEHDRGTALDDRTASANDRQYAALLAASLQFGWTVRGLDPPAFLYVSPGYLRILGLDQKRSNLTMSEALAVAHPDDLAAATESYARRSWPSGPSETEMRIVRPDGEVRWLRSISKTVTENEGDEVRVATTVEDITDRKKAEAAAQHAHEAAERANLAKSEFLSRMSHELRTPLNAVLGFAQLLELSSLNSLDVESVKQILRAGSHLLDLINEVLDISRIESGSLTLSREPVALRDVIDESASLVRPMATARGITLVLPEASSCDAFVLADKQRSKQVLANLLSNAIKYNQPAGLVDVTWERASDQVVLRVRDTGIGIAPEDLPRLFTPFDRLGAENSEIDGSGIGLSISLKLVEAMNGTLAVESVPGTGTTFTVSLPEVEMLGSETPDDPPPGPTIDLGGGLVVLYIEDNLPNLRLMERLVSFRPQWRLTQATSGSHGIDLAFATRPDLVLLDLHLPDLSGSQVLLQLKANPRTADIPVYLVSADATRDSRRELMAAGAQGYLTKPINVVEVLAVFDTVASELPTPRSA